MSSAHLVMRCDTSNPDSVAAASKPHREDAGAVRRAGQRRGGTTARRAGRPVAGGSNAVLLRQPDRLSLMRPGFRRGDARRQSRRHRPRRLDRRHAAARFQRRLQRQQVRRADAVAASSRANGDRPACAAMSSARAWSKRRCRNRSTIRRGVTRAAQRRGAVAADRQPQDMADAILYLASDRAGPTSTAQELLVDGGYRRMLIDLVPRPGYD